MVETQKAVSAGAYNDAARLLNGEFMIYASPRPGVDVASLTPMLEAEIEKIKTDPVSAAELARAKLQLVSGLVFARDSQQSMAQIFGQAAAQGMSPQDVLAWTDEIEAVTAADVRAAAQSLLQSQHAITGHLRGQTP